MADVGKYRQALSAGMQRRIPAFQRAAPFSARVELISEDIRQFTDSAELNAIPTRELSVAVGMTMRGPFDFTLTVSPSFTSWRSDTLASVGAAGVSLRLADGRRLADAQLVLEADANSRFQRVRVEDKRRWRMGDFHVTSRARLGWSHDAPLQEQFILGGYDGFGGLHTTERRGDQEAMAGVSVARSVFGPIRLRGEMMTGAVGRGNGLFVRRAGTVYGQFITGGRLGGELRSDVLTVQIERGFNTAHGGIWFIRLGQWF
jgi:hypothetical protein